MDRRDWKWINCLSHSLAEDGDCSFGGGGRYFVRFNRTVVAFARWVVSILAFADCPDSSISFELQKDLKRPRESVSNQILSARIAAVGIVLCTDH